ncbi:DUF389 domain-containing protein [Vreelandella nanhaiensis]|uniref:DUF389 domain-containing protein n=1 Tax=Vreelandella nanhaiensis TaxID=1258546 RepID=A0A3S0W8C6_9GAMM|nr:DUF389 domain-containing protein [Halomonas nanhaiensis]RUR31657.1 DUF389 domain-containing protein [Halomonas nanhaiensis]
MPRTIEVSAPTKTIDAILERIELVQGVVSISLQKGASLSPPGDVLTIQATDEATRLLLGTLTDLNASVDGTISLSEPTSLLSSEHQRLINKESNETIWDDMAFLLRRDTNLSVNYLMLMALAGAITAAGLWSDTLHLIVGSMIIAPAFEPLLRLPLGLITRAKELIPSGLISTGAGYLALAMGAAFATMILMLWESGEKPGLADQQWINYWTSLSFSGVLISCFGAIAGPIIVTAQRSVMTVGVMITLALIPSMGIVGMGLVIGDLALAGQGFMRWCVDAALVTTMSAIVFGLKKRFLHYRLHALS